MPRRLFLHNVMFQRIRSRKEAKLVKEEQKAESKRAEKEAKKNVKIKEEEIKRLLQSSGKYLLPHL